MRWRADADRMIERLGWQSRRGRRGGLSAVTGNGGDRARTRADGDDILPAVCGLGKVYILIVLVEHSIGSAEERVPKDSNALSYSCTVSYSQAEEQDGGLAGERLEVNCFDHQR